MYDKKTWVILAICGILLAANTFFQQKESAKKAELQKQEEFLKNAQQTVAQKETTTSINQNNSIVAAIQTSNTSLIETLVTLESPEASFTFSNIGGGVRYTSLKKEYEIGNEKIPIKINSRSVNAVASILKNSTAKDELVYQYLADQSEAGKSVVFSAQTQEGINVKKIFRLQQDFAKPGNPYLLDLDITFENPSTSSISLDQYALSLGETSPLNSKEIASQSTLYFQDGGDYKYSSFSASFIDRKIPKEGDKLTQTEMIGLGNQFFTTAFVSKTPFASHLTGTEFEIKFPNDDKPHKGINGQLKLPAEILSKGQNKTFSFLLYMGPKDNTMLRSMGGSWGEIMNYGWFSPISRFLNFMLHWIHAVMDKISSKWTWGFAIIILTLIVRSAIWPLYNKSARSMKRMALLKPEMDKIKQKYGDDAMKVNQETMKLYKTYGVNPIGGCLPMLLQIPIFFGFYRMLQYAVELRHESFLWVADLSQPDTLLHIAGYPINLLPIVMTITSFLQIKMTPQSGDPMQRKIMMFMPFMFLVFCYSFASALALYWTTQNIFTIFQTWISSKLPEPALKEKTITTKPGKKSFMERMVEQQAAMQKAKASGQNMRDVTPEKKRNSKTGG
jgi:YidC/Oxa1 family membrane protein insertase